MPIWAGVAPKSSAYKGKKGNIMPNPTIDMKVPAHTTRTLGYLLKNSRAELLISRERVVHLNIGQLRVQTEKPGLTFNDRGTRRWRMAGAALSQP